MDKKNLNPYTFDDLGGNLLVCRGNMLLGLALLMFNFLEDRIFIVGGDSNFLCGSKLRQDSKTDETDHADLNGLF
ncbi:MAG: hypothetical protein RIR11_2818 [Bacteroidota bacterium]|jgi:hypothetical protein